MRHVLVTGGAGYVGSELVPRLLREKYRVSVVDLFIYGDDLLDAHENLKIIKGDIRDPRVLDQAFQGDVTDVIHLACISNDPSFELDPALGKSINLDSFEPLISRANATGVRRFLNASSSSVYGVKNISNVVETETLEPLTDYSKFKAMTESIAVDFASDDFICCNVRPATVCGYSRRQRFDVIVNILTNHAWNNGVIKLLGGEQKRPNVHINDMINAYIFLLEAPERLINREAFNIGFENKTVKDLGSLVQRIVADFRNSDIQIITEPSIDNRSYHINSDKIRAIGFKYNNSIEQAVVDLCERFQAGCFTDSLASSRFFNIKRMQEVRLQ